MIMLILGLILFLGIHFIAITATPLRARLTGTLGELGWKGVYGVVALVGLYLIATGYAAARMSPVVLYVPPHWTRHLVMLLMVPVFIMWAAAYLPGRIQSTLKYPLLVAVKLWALSHLLANGTLADIVLFGAFLAAAVVTRIVLKRSLTQTVAVGPTGRWNDLVAVVSGLVIYALFVVWAHKALIGVSPMGM